MKARPWLWILVVALAVAVLLAPFASSWPDGLEKVAEVLGFAQHARTSALPAPVPDYAMPGMVGRPAVAAAGLLGALLVCGQLKFDPATGQLFYGEQEISLTPTEASIMHHLMKNAGRVVTHTALAVAVWGMDYPDAADSLRVHIRRLRTKLEADPSDPRIVLTRAGVGYLLARPEEA